MELEKELWRLSVTDEGGREMQLVAKQIVDIMHRKRKGAKKNED